jgi:hypothetical protein
MIGALKIDEDVFAELAQCLPLLLGAQMKALEGERRVRPGTVELGDVHAELEVPDVDLLALHAT